MNTLNNLPQAEEAPPQEQGDVQNDQVAEASQEEDHPSEEPQDTKPRDVDEPPDPSSLQQEIERLEQKRREAQEKAEYWRKQKAEARAEYFRDRREPPPEEKPKGPPAGMGPEPRATDFQDYDEYVKALTDWRVQSARMEWEINDAKRRQDEENRERRQNLQAKLNEGYSRYEDFEEVVFDPTASHMTEMVVDIIADCDSPADVAYYLAKNRIDGMAISRMTPTRAAREIARIEAKIAGEARAPVQPKPKVSGAPPPIKPVSAQQAGVKNPDKMTQKEYEEWRRSQGARPF